MHDKIDFFFFVFLFHNNFLNVLKIEIKLNILMANAIKMIMIIVLVHKHEWQCLQTLNKLGRIRHVLFLGLFQMRLVL